MFCVEMLVLQLSLVSPAEASFHCEDVRDLEFFVECDSSSGFLCFRVIKPAILSTEVIKHLTHDKREYSGRVPIIEFVAIHEDVLPPGVPVEVAEEFNFSFFLEVSAHLLESTDRRMQNLAGDLIPPIEISPREGTSIVAIDDAIRVHHWDYLEHVEFTKHLSFLTLPHQELHHSSHHPRSVRLTRMDSSGDNYTLLLLCCRLASSTSNN